MIAIMSTGRASQKQSSPPILKSCMKHNLINVLLLALTADSVPVKNRKQKFNGMYRNSDTLTTNIGEIVHTVVTRAHNGLEYEASGTHCVVYMYCYSVR